MAHAERPGGAEATHIRAGTVAELTEKGMAVVQSRQGPILVVHHEGAFHALDNRCPHLGFPLHRGSVEDGILTCHWHHARFDLGSGGTFDLWADDVPVCVVEVRGDEVWVAAECGDRFAASYWRTRLHDGMAHNLGLVIGKAVLALLDRGVPAAELVEEALLFGARHRDGWGAGMTILTALANVLPISTRKTAIWRCSRAFAASPTTPTARRPGASAGPSATARSMPGRSRAGCATGRWCATATAASAPCSPPSPHGPDRGRCATCC